MTEYFLELNNVNQSSIFTASISNTQFSSTKEYFEFGSRHGRSLSYGNQLITDTMYNANS